MSDSPVLEVYRAPMHSRSDDVDHDAAVRWALGRGVVAVGGLLPEPPRGLEDAVDRLEQVGDARIARRLHRFAEVEMSSFVWSRTEDDGQWWLGRLAGPWAYDSADDAARADLPHTRACRWLDDPVADDRVPETVRASFARGGRNFQRIHGDDVEPATKQVWDSLA